MAACSKCYIGILSEAKFEVAQDICGEGSNIETSLNTLDSVLFTY